MKLQQSRFIHCLKRSGCKVNQNTGSVSYEIFMFLKLDKKKSKKIENLRLQKMIV